MLHRMHVKLFCILNFASSLMSCISLNSNWLGSNCFDLTNCRMRFLAAKTYFVWDATQPRCKKKCLFELSSINRKTIPKFCDISLASHITNLCLNLALCKFLKDVNITSKCRQQGLKKGLSAFTLEMKRRIKCLDYKMGMADPLEIFLVSRLLKPDWGSFDLRLFS